MVIITRLYKQVCTIKVLTNSLIHCKIKFVADAITKLSELGEMVELV